MAAVAQVEQSLVRDGASVIPRPLWIVALVAAAIGLFFRLYGLERSFWLDELGTLWAIEGSFTTVIERAFAFHNDSPFYYLLAWLWTHAFGESEVTLRLLSVCFGAGTAYATYKLGETIDSRKVGLTAAVLIWLSYALVEADATARSYSAAAFFLAIMLLGFARAVMRAQRKGRILFVAGAIGLFASHYVLASISVWVGAGYLMFRELRTHYPVSRFGLDVVIAAICTLPCLPHLLAVWNRRGDVANYLAPPDYLGFVEILLPLVIPALLSLDVKGDSGTSKAFVRLLWLMLIMQAATLSLVAETAANLLERRFLIVLVLPASLLAARAVRLPWVSAALALVCWSVATGLIFFVHYSATGVFSRSIVQDWRRGVVRVNESLAKNDPSAPVLFRPCFLEEERVLYEKGGDYLRAPLRSPGKKSPDWNLMFLNHSWNTAPLREQYFQRKVAPAIRDAKSFYYFSCNFYNDVTGDYPEKLKEWVAQNFPGRFRHEEIPAGRGLLLLRFERIGDGAGVENGEGAG